jgi:hypothetical protein
LKNNDPKKQAKSPDITHHKDPNRTAKAWWRPPANEIQKRPPIEGFSDDQYEFSKHVHQDMQHTTKLDHKKG